MHKIKIITKADGTMLVVAILNPGVTAGRAVESLNGLKAQFGKWGHVIVVPYATHVEVANQSLWASLKSWWASRGVKEVEQ